jgi:hypothetical protein
VADAENASASSIDSSGGTVAGRGVGTGRDFTGRDTNTTINQRQERDVFDLLNSKLDLAIARIVRIEHLLQGEFGTRGLVWLVDLVRDAQVEIKDQLRDIQITNRSLREKTFSSPNERGSTPPLITVIYLIVSSLALVVAITLYVALPR